MKPQKLDNNFARKVGVYFLGIEEVLKVYELDTGNICFLYSDNSGGYIELNLFKSFDKNKKWGLYFDDDKNLWFYSDDTKQTTVWIKKDSLYIEHDFCKEDITIPSTFLEYLKIDKKKLCEN